MERNRIPLVIVGAGGFGREVKWLIERCNREQIKNTGYSMWDLLGFIDDGIPKGRTINGLPVLGGREWVLNLERECAVVCALGRAKSRKRMIDELSKNKRIFFPNVIDPSVIMAEDISLGKGNIICSGSILTVNIQIHDFAILNLDCTVGHDTVINSFVTLYPSVNLSGGVTVGECCEIGTGCHVIQNIEIGSQVILGAGAVVIRDIPENCVAAGNPAKVIKVQEEL